MATSTRLLITLALSAFYPIFCLFQCVHTHQMFSGRSIEEMHVNFCVLVITEEADDETITIFEELRNIMKEERAIVMGKVQYREFKWPDGRGLELANNWKSDRTPSIVGWSKRQLDRSCLLQTRQNPKTIAYSGLHSINDILKFVNDVCNTHRTLQGYFSVAGLHREEILSNLFHVKNISNITMKYATKSRSLTGQTCDIHHIDSKCKHRHSITNPSSNSKYDITKCDKISMPTKHVFFHEYLKRSRPVIIKNALQNWTAITKWTNDYLIEKFGENQVHIKIAPKGEFEGVEKAELWENFNHFKIPPTVKAQLQNPDLVVVRPATMDIKFSDFMKMIENTNAANHASVYLEYSSIPQYMPELREDITEIPFIKGLLKMKHLNMWLSDGNTLGKLHFDPFDNLLCQINGRKQVTMFDPHNNEMLYEGHIPEALLSYDVSANTFHRRNLLDSTSMVMSPVDILAPDFQRFPQFSDARPIDCTLDEGDVLFMPAFWWHEVQSYPNMQQKRNLAINFWYEPFLSKEFPCADCKLDINTQYRHLL